MKQIRISVRVTNKDGSSIWVEQAMFSSAVFDSIYEYLFTPNICRLIEERYNRYTDVPITLTDFKIKIIEKEPFLWPGTTNHWIVDVLDGVRLTMLNDIRYFMKKE